MMAATTLLWVSTGSERRLPTALGMELMMMRGGGGGEGGVGRGNQEGQLKCCRPTHGSLLNSSRAPDTASGCSGGVEVVNSNVAHNIKNNINFGRSFQHEVYVHVSVAFSCCPFKSVHYQTIGPRQHVA